MEDYTRFIRTNGHLLFQCPQFDIIQLGLLQSKSSYVYQDALSTAKDTKHQIYFEWFIQFTLKPNDKALIFPFFFEQLQFHRHW